MVSQKLKLSQVPSEEKLQKLMNLVDALSIGESADLLDDGGLAELLQMLPQNYKKRLRVYAVEDVGHDQQLHIIRQEDADGGCCGSCSCGG